MFTGIIEEVGTVKLARPASLTISAREVLQGSKVGDSVAVNGACLTITAMDSGTFTVDVAPETLQRTNLGSLRPGSLVNLERAVPLGGRLGGHIVQGHVDATGKVVSITPKGNSVLVRYTAPPQVMRYVVEKGFIAVDGMSLTVTDYDSTSFRVSVIPYTLEHTNLARLHVGDSVNLEVDIIAKYVERLKEGRSGISLDFLAEHGFSSASSPLST
ncbi:MAG: riboflavin synthase [Chloroflexi bacterium]|nr:MAG: riboflavin synthase [Chloroflexota bacterium]RLC97430.1 MAG: riboflavin synthase [Chloroflexota bacterium]